MFSNYTIKTKTFNFKPFYKKFSEVYPNLKQPSSPPSPTTLVVVKGDGGGDEFLEWFIGFSEGEGSFIAAKRGDLSFVIGLSSKDIQTLNYIKDTLGFGRVVVQSSKLKIHRFIVSDINNLRVCKNLLLIFSCIIFSLVFCCYLDFCCVDII